MGAWFFVCFDLKRPKGGITTFRIDVWFYSLPNASINSFFLTI